MDPLEEYKCPVCMDVYDEPVKLPCKHVICQVCLDGILTHTSAKCPLCKQEFDESDTKTATDIEAALRRRRASCPYCSKQVPLTSWRDHQSVCDESELELSGGATAHSKVSSTYMSGAAKKIEAPNRSTFKCPYCDVPNLDHKSLLNHVNQLHQDDRSKVVCPICASMPWGDSSLLSSDFHGHLNTRHKFEYDTYVDYDEDEEETLRKIIELSMNEK